MTRRRLTTECAPPAYPAIPKGECCEVGVAVMPLDGADCYPDPCARMEANEPKDPCQVDNTLYAIVTAPFNMPACGQSAEFQTRGALRFAAGTVLYSPAVGYLYVSGVRDDWTLIVRNDCGPCQTLQPGEVVLPNTVFALGGPACAANAGGAGSPDLSPYLDSDLVVPAVGQCVNVKFTNVFGLHVGDIVSIHQFQFRIGAIIDSTTVQLCNDGAGGEPNSVIQHDPDNDEVANYPVVRTGGENPCTGTSASTAKRILGCDGGGVEVGVVGSIEGHIPVWNASTGQWELQVIESAQVCAVTTSDLIVDPGAPEDNEYPVTVSPNNSLLTEEWNKVTPNFLRVTINGKPFCMTTPVSSGTIRVRKAYDLSIIGIDIIPAGALVCVVGCCDQCTPYIETSDLSGGANPNITEAHFTLGTTTWSAPNGVSVHTFPVGIGQAGAGGTVDTDGAWVLKYKNGDSCACRKYVEVMSNFECALDLPDDIFGNIEFRMLKVLPILNTFTGAAIPVTGGRRQLAALNGTPNLLIGGNAGDFGLINTFKGHMFDRDEADPGIIHQYQGHIRIVLENTTGGPLNVSFACSWRAWLKASNFELVTDPTA